MEAFAARAVQPAEQLVQSLAQPFALRSAGPQSSQHLGEQGFEQGGVVGQLGQIDRGNDCGGCTHNS
jgi:hypothetical protein